MNIIHIMKDGKQLQSLEGVVIQSEEFYKVFYEIQKKTLKASKNKAV